MEKSDEENKLKPGHEPWPKEEVARMQLGINQLVYKTLNLESELLRTNTGLDEMDKEIQANIDQQAIKVKLEKMNLADLLFDQTHEITIKKHKNRKAEIEQEIALNQHNIKAHQAMLGGGRPKKKEEKNLSMREMTKEELEKEKKK